MQREESLNKLEGEGFDVLIIGAGINGAVCAAALSAQGVKVCLIDGGDFGGQTSQESSNLVWGGIKYLENFEFGLVRRLCLARNRMLRAYPCTIREIRFLTTIEKGARFPPLIFYLGAWVYWLIGNGFTRPPTLLGERGINNRERSIRVENVVGGFEYSDAYLPESDARFVFDFVKKAQGKGSATVNYLESLGSQRRGDQWLTEVRDVITGQKRLIRSRLLINACGPMVDDHNRRSGINTRHHHLFSKGVHLIINRVAEGNRILAFFASDGRLFFAIPMGPKSCVGTTDTRIDSLPPAVTPEDRRFILDNINERLTFNPPLTEADIISERCGVRPLVGDPVAKTKDKGDWSSLSRKHVLERDSKTGHLSIFGGKLTDCLNVGNEIIKAVSELGIGLPHRNRKWFGEPPREDYRRLLRRAASLRLDNLAPPEFSEPSCRRLWRRTNIAQIIPRESLQKDRGVREACEALFNNKAEEAFNEYFNSKSGKGGKLSGSLIGSADENSG